MKWRNSFGKLPIKQNVRGITARKCAGTLTVSTALNHQMILKYQQEDNPDYSLQSSYGVGRRIVADHQV